MRNEGTSRKITMEMHCLMGIMEDWQINKSVILKRLRTIRVLKQEPHIEKKEWEL